MVQAGTQINNEHQLYSIDPETRAADLHFHPGQWRAWSSSKRFVAVISGTQGGKTSFGPWWLWREIQRCGRGDYLAVTATYDLFQLKMLPEMLNVFQHILGIGRLHAGAGIIELRNPETSEFEGKHANDPNMWGRIILRSASAEGGLESATAKAAWLDEAGQDAFKLTAWQAVRRRLSLHRGRVLITTTPYNLGWLKQQIYDRWKGNDPDIDVIQFASTMNPVFPQDEFEAARQSMQDWKFRMFYKGQFEKPAGLIYRDFIDEYREQGGHKVAPFELPHHWPRYVGVDPGAVNMGMVWLAHDTDEDVYYLYRESLTGRKPSEEHARDAKQLAEMGKERVIQWAVGNKSEVQPRLDWMAAGVRSVVEPEFSDVESGLDRVTALIKQFRLYVFDDCAGVLDEMGTYARKLDGDDEPTKNIEDKSKYHLLDALRYVAIAVNKQVMTYHRVKVKRIEL